MWARGCFLSPPPPLRGPPPPLTQGRLGYAPFSRRITQYQLPPPMRGKWRAQRADRGAHAARGFVGGAAYPDKYNRLHFLVSMPHAALWVVQLVISDAPSDTAAFQCRTRLCGWCSAQLRSIQITLEEFQCRTRLCGWCSRQCGQHRSRGSCFNAARGFVGGAACGIRVQFLFFRSFNAARGFVGGAAPTGA